MAKKRNLEKEINELGIIAIEGDNILSEKSVFAAIDAIQKNDSERPVHEELEHIRDLQQKKQNKIQGCN